MAVRRKDSSYFEPHEFNNIESGDENEREKVHLPSTCASNSSSRQRKEGSVCLSFPAVIEHEPNQRNQRHDRTEQNRTEQTEEEKNKLTIRAHNDQ